MYFLFLFFNRGMYVSSVQDGIYALGKAHMRSPTLPLKRFQCSDDSPLSSFQGRSSSASSFNACLRQAINGVMSFALCLLVVSQASQHFRSSEKQATCEGCFAYQCICSVIFLHSGMSRAVHTQEFSKVDVCAFNSTFHFL